MSIQSPPSRKPQSPAAYEPGDDKARVGAVRSREQPHPVTSAFEYPAQAAKRRKVDAPEEAAADSKAAAAIEDLQSGVESVQNERGDYEYSIIELAGSPHEKTDALIERLERLSVAELAEILRKCNAKLPVHGVELWANSDHAFVLRVAQALATLPQGPKRYVILWGKSEGYGSVPETWPIGAVQFAYQFEWNDEIWFNVPAIGPTGMFGPVKSTDLLEF